MNPDLQRMIKIYHPPHPLPSREGENIGGNVPSPLVGEG